MHESNDIDIRGVRALKGSGNSFLIEWDYRLKCQSVIYLQTIAP